MQDSSSSLARASSFDHQRASFGCEPSCLEPLPVFSFLGSLHSESCILKPESVLGSAGCARAADRHLPPCNKTFIGVGLCLLPANSSCLNAVRHHFARVFEETNETVDVGLGVGGGAAQDDIERGSTKQSMQAFGCASVEGHQVASETVPAVVPWCRDGAASWGTCAHGEWLCEEAFLVPANSNATQVVESALVLNLAASVGRLRRLRREFARRGLDVPRRMPAIQAPTPQRSSAATAPADLSSHQVMQFLGPFYGGFEFRGAKGLVKVGDLSVALSHLAACWRVLAESPTGASAGAAGPWHLVLEDDAVLDLPGHVLIPRAAQSTHGELAGEGASVMIRLERVPTVTTPVLHLLCPAA